MKYKYILICKYLNVYENFYITICLCVYLLLCTCINTAYSI